MNALAGIWLKPHRSYPVDQKKGPKTSFWPNVVRLPQSTRRAAPPPGAAKEMRCVELCISITAVGHCAPSPPEKKKRSCLIELAIVGAPRIVAVFTARQVRRRARRWCAIELVHAVSVDAEREHGTLARVERAPFGADTADVTLSSGAVLSTTQPTSNPFASALPATSVAQMRRHILVGALVDHVAA